MPGQLFENVIEHRPHVLREIDTRGCQRSLLFRVALRIAHGRCRLLLERRVTLVVPFAEGDQVRLEPFHGIAERPGIGLGRRAVG
jgi:hypothetical protein